MRYCSGPRAVGGDVTTIVATVWEQLYHRLNRTEIYELRREIRLPYPVDFLRSNRIVSVVHRYILPSRLCRINW